MKLYVAYGSNLNKNQMIHRCPDSIPLGNCFIPNWELAFNHYATIKRKKNGKCHAGLWLISEKDEKVLDIYEGVRNKLYRKIYVDCIFTGKIIFNEGKKIDKVLTYQMIISDSNKYRSYSKSFETYYQICKEGYLDFELNTMYLDKKAKKYIKTFDADENVGNRKEFLL